ncbi:Werner syndrome-like exonuclease [Tanacetum coccineum]
MTKEDKKKRTNTLVTETPYYVDQWISRIERIHSRRLDNLVVGLDIEWRPNHNAYVENQVAILQLCVGRRCLIFQIMHAPFIPKPLIKFLSNPSYTFVGVGVNNDVSKLWRDYRIGVGRTADLRPLAVQGFNANELKNAGLKGLTRWVLGKDLVKPKYVTMSRWDNEWLTLKRVQYACVDAFLSFEIGRSLIYGD